MESVIAPIAKIWCYFAGNTTLAAVLAGVAVVGLIIMFIVDEGNSYISTVIRIMLGAGLLVSLPTLLQQIFGINLCTTDVSSLIPGATGGGGSGGGGGLIPGTMGVGGLIPGIL